MAGIGCGRGCWGVWFDTATFEELRAGFPGDFGMDSWGSGWGVERGGRCAHEGWSDGVAAGRQGRWLLLGPGPIRQAQGRLDAGMAEGGGAGRFDWLKGGSNELGASTGRARTGFRRGRRSPSAGSGKVPLLPQERVKIGGLLAGDGCCVRGVVRHGSPKDSDPAHHERGTEGWEQLARQGARGGLGAV